MKIVTICFLLLLTGCDNVAPVTDIQVKTVTERCKELGLSVKVQNNHNNSSIECVEVN